MTELVQKSDSQWRRTLGLSLLIPALLMLVRGVGSEQYRHWIWSEQGPLESSHVLIPLFAMGLGLVTLFRHRNVIRSTSADLRWVATAILGLSLMCFAIAGEEASWGQHLVGWSTPEAWSEVNDQQETNLHNIGSWADQKPRAIVELAVLLFGIVWPVWHLLTSREIRSWWGMLLPPLSVLPIALFAEGSRLLETIPKLLGTAVPSAFPRPSELQEFYFYTFFALCMWTWRQRLVTGLADEQSHEVTLPQSDLPYRRAA